MKGLAPSVVSADLANLAISLKAVEPYAARWHVDVMDGHYVPNLTIGPTFLKAVRGVSSLDADVHLMVTNPNTTWRWYAEAGASGISFHPECSDDPAGLLSEISGADIAAGIAINPNESANAISSLVAACDFVVVMTVVPGFSGQSFIADGLKNVREARSIGGPDLEIVVDGGVGPSNAQVCIDAGADVLVSASSIFSAADPAAAAKQLSDFFAE